MFAGSWRNQGEAGGVAFFKNSPEIKEAIFLKKGTAIRELARYKQDRFFISINATKDGTHAHCRWGRAKVICVPSLVVVIGRTAEYKTGPDCRAVGVPRGRGLPCCHRMRSASVSPRNGRGGEKLRARK